MMPGMKYKLVQTYKAQKTVNLILNEYFAGAAEFSIKINVT